MQLDVQKERPHLYSYLKLAYGMKDGKAFELDFADYKLERKVELKNTQWLQVNDLTVCPLGMFKGSLND